jgi:hypothetical protein
MLFSRRLCWRNEREGIEVWRLILGGQWDMMWLSDPSYLGSWRIRNQALRHGSKGRHAHGKHWRVFSTEDVP